MKAFEHKRCSSSFQKLMCPESIVTHRFVGSPLKEQALPKDFYIAVQELHEQKSLK